MSGAFEARWRAEMREHGIPEDKITELWDAGRKAGRKAGMSEARLDYFGVRPECGCVTAWMAADDATQAEVRDFYRSMADSGREVRRAVLTEEMRVKISRCAHHRNPDTLSRPTDSPH